MSKSELSSLRSLGCIVCHRRPVDLCHIKTKKAGGPMEPFNIFPACRTHHQEQHRIGIITFLVRHPSFSDYVQSNGWEILDQVGKTILWHPRLAGDAA